MDIHDSDGRDIAALVQVSSPSQLATPSPDRTAHARTCTAALARRHAGGYALLHPLFQYCLLHLYLFLHVALLGGGSPVGSPKRGGRWICRP